MSRRVVLALVAVPLVAIAAMLLVAHPELTVTCESAFSAERAAAARAAERWLAVTTLLAGLVGLAALLGASMRLRGGGPGWPTVALAGFLVVQFVLVRAGAPDAVSPGLWLALVGYFAVLIPFLSLPLAAGMVMIAWAVSPPERRADGALWAVAGMAVAIFLPGAAAAAYDRFEPFCFN